MLQGCQTHKNHKGTNDLNQLDRLARSILLSTRDIPKQESISKIIKFKILRAIHSDNPSKLDQLLQKHVVSFDREIGTRGSRWNIVHFCAKNNAHHCMNYILQTQFQQNPTEYTSLLNYETVERYTALTICIIYGSHKVLQNILEMGGVDIHVLDAHKMSPSEIALNYKNDQAIRLLINYQSKTKRRQFINKHLLSSPILFPQKISCYQKMMSCMCGCLTFGAYDDEDDELEIRQEDNIKMGNKSIDYVPIKSKKQLNGYQIQWKSVSSIMMNRIPLFSSYNPYEILQSNFTINNNLIIFQCLSQQPWLIRKNIRPHRCRTNFYEIDTYPNRLMEKQCTDDYIPFIKDRNEIMFLSNQQEMWPMLLQKSLAKTHKSYFALAQVNPKDLLQEITGFPTAEISLKTIPDKNLISFLQSMLTKNYLFLLKGKKGSDLCEQKDKVDCFTILNFYENKEDQLLLINCPFISETWKEKEKSQPLALKLIKGHYNAHRQMCVWIEANKLRNYFESIIVSMCFTNYERIEVKIKSGEFIFFRFRLQENREENIFFQLSNQANKKILNLSNLQIIKNEGKQFLSPVNNDNKKLEENLAELEFKTGEYMCHFQIDKSESPQSLLLLCWSIQNIQIEFVESELAALEWLGFLKNHFHSVEEQCVLEVLGDYSLITFRDKSNDIVLFRMNLNPEDIIEGHKDKETGFVEMLRDGNVSYCIVKRIVSDQQIEFHYKKIDISK